MTINIAELERRIERLERAKPVTLRQGTVTGVEGGYVRVEIPGSDGVISQVLPTLQKRVLVDQDIEMPDLGEPVAVLTGPTGAESGIMLGAVYSPVCKDPGQASHMQYAKFCDGTIVSYDREAHKFFMHCEGKIEVYAKDDIDVTTDANVTVNVKGNATVDVKGNMSVMAEGSISIESKTSLTAKAPVIALKGRITETGTDGGSTTVALKGTMTATGGDVIADGKSLKTHKHMGVHGPTQPPM